MFYITLLPLTDIVDKMCQINVTFFINIRQLKIVVIRPAIFHNNFLIVLLNTTG